MTLTLHKSQVHCSGIMHTGVPRVSHTGGQSQFGRPHPVRSWQHRCQKWFGNKGASKVIPAPHLVVSIDPLQNFTW